MEKAIFFDVDGTILDCLNGINSITSKVEQAIKDLPKKILRDLEYLKY